MTVDIGVAVSGGLVTPTSLGSGVLGGTGVFVAAGVITHRAPAWSGPTVAFFSQAVRAKSTNPATRSKDLFIWLSFTLFMPCVNSHNRN